MPPEPEFEVVVGQFEFEEALLAEAGIEVGGSFSK